MKNKKGTKEILEKIASIMGVFLVILIFYTAFTGTFNVRIQRNIFLVIIIPIILIRYPLYKSGSKNYIKYLDIVLILLCVASFAWILIQYPRIMSRMKYADPVTAGDLIFGSLAVFFILDATRRVMGWILVITTCIFIAYTFLGPYMPGIFVHAGTSYRLFIEQLYLGEEGIFGVITGVVATYLFLFVSFGTILKESGVDIYYMDLCLAIAGKSRGGPAKVAVISSALMGTITGSTTANVATTGALTIPMMKNIGYKAEDAAAIEAAASTGGAITPPMMGAGVFIMAQITGIPLIVILKYSIIPAILYFVSIFFYIDLSARKYKIEGLSKNQIPNLKKMILKSIHLFIPIVVLIILLINQYTPFFASASCCILTIFLSWIRKETRMGLKKIINALDKSTKNMMTIGAVSVCAGIIMGLISLTGLIMKVTSILMIYSQGIVLLAIFFLACIAYILGMGMPVTLSYILVSTLGAGALRRLGIPLLSSHLAIFWFSQLSTLSPPICMTAFVAARIAQTESYMKVGFKSISLGIGLIVIPFLFIYTPLLSDNLLLILLVFIKALFVFFIMMVIQLRFLIKSLNYWQEIILIFTLIISVFILIDPRLISIIFLVIVSIPILMIGIKQLKEIKDLHN